MDKTKLSLDQILSSEDQTIEEIRKKPRGRMLNGYNESSWRTHCEEKFLIIETRVSMEFNIFRGK